MQSIFRDMAQAIKANFLLLLVFSAVITAAEVFFPGSTQRFGASFFISTFVVYFLHRQVLFGPSGYIGGLGQAEDGLIPKDSFFRFSAVSAFFLGLTLLPAMFAAYEWSMFLRGQFDKAQFVGMSLIVSLVLLWLLLACLGTALPAAASKLPFSLGRAWRAGRKTGLRVAGQLIVFPGLTFVVLVSLALLLDRIFGARLAVAPVSYAVGIVGGVLITIPSVMTVVILVRAFKAAYPVD